ncbi:DNA translocase FtsK [Evansella sp. AB-rgal1]|uniref:DNA translocase FtsK n=1 Tax=Evansella sp. AB-rgal1 TaxID=3242696 RepID=UPI00359D8593
MGKRMYKLIASMREWLFPKEEQRSVEKKQVYQKTQGVNVRNTPPRVIHQYPKTGNFRFPVIKDEEFGSKKEGVSKREASRKKVSETGNMIRTTVNKAKNDSEWKKNKDIKKSSKFQGNKFSATVTPSPIYGYRKPPYKKETTSLETDLINAPLSLTQKADEIFDTPPPIHNNNVSMEIAGNEKFHQPEEQASIQLKHDSMIEEKIEDETIFIEKQQDYEIVIKEEEKPATQNEVMAKEETNREKATSSANQIPFNVIMLPKDRVNHKKKEESRKQGYNYPTLPLLNVPLVGKGVEDDWITSQVKTLNETLDYFSIRAKVVHVTKGPSVTRFEIQPEPGVKVSKIVNLTDDLKLSLAAKEIRMEAPIPGKNTIGIEVPNDVSQPVFLREVLRHKNFQQGTSPLTVGLGVDISGEPIVTDIQKMPHGLIAGSTGSGKSVCVNSILISLIYKSAPKDVRLLLIDPKMVELAPYNGIPHLASPVITDPKEATEGLKWAVAEMDRRYELFAAEGTRDLMRYNEKLRKVGREDNTLPYLVIVVDELADLMMVAPNDVEEAICRIAQKARACGIHLLVATQRPSVDVITGLIKANIPTRIAFSVSSQADSRTILDGSGAERLLGKGDMLFLENGSGKPVRLQGTFVSDDEIDRVVEHVKKAGNTSFLFEKETLQHQILTEAEDDLFSEACEFVCDQHSASASLLQRQFRIGYNRAARLIDDMEDRGYISPSNGSKPRDVYLTKDEIKGKINKKGEI